MNKELIWKPLHIYNKNCSELYDYSNIYLVSETGIIYNIKRKNILKPFKHNSGYVTIALSKNGKSKYFFIHRIVLSSFKSNKNLLILNKIQVNHIDRNKINNNIKNLEWVTPKENSLHSYLTTFNIDKRINKIQYSEFIFVCDIKTNKNYEIYSDGRVYSKRTKKFLSPKFSNGYLSVVLYPEAKTYLIHRLVAIEFVKNNDLVNKIYVNHIDENKQNNIYKNLEWVTASQNSLHSLSKKVYQYDLQGNFINVFNSIKDAAIKTNVSECSISSVTSSTNKSLTSGGYIWSNLEQKISPEYIKNLNKKNSRILGVIQLDKNNIEINRYESICIASKLTKLDSSAITKVCLGKAKTCGSFIWKYINSEKRIKIFTKEDNNEIKNQYNNGMTTKELSIIYNKSISCIQRIVKVKN